MNVYKTVAFAGLLCLFGDDSSAQAGDSAATARACRACHAGQFASIARNPHSAVDSELSCTGCHGDVTAHISAGGRAAVFAYDEESPLRQSEACNSCHADSHPQYAASPHARAGLTCTGCHSVHNAEVHAPGLLKAPARAPSGVRPQSAVCADCHQASFAQFELNERHRLETVDCASCHDSHGPDTRSLLGGFRQQACAACHLDKEGPFVFEHQASRVEGCIACHSPHGSPNRHLLTHQSTGELCYTCHAVVPQFHAGFAPVGPPRFGLDTQCTNCHVSIHGSNLDPGFLR